MKKTKNYERTRFSADTIAAAQQAFERLCKDPPRRTFSVTHGPETWTFNNLDEFVADFRRGSDCQASTLSSGGSEQSLAVIIGTTYSVITVEAAQRQQIESIAQIFEAAAPSARIPDPPPRPAPPPPPPVKERKPVVFIGHGRSKQWRDLKDHLTDKHGIQVEAYEVGARAGHTVRDILDEMLGKSTMALLVLTAEDEMGDGEKRARQNVIHETGLFQGRLGFGRAIVLLEAGAEEFSNIHGIDQLRFSAGNIKETFGDVLAVMRREFPKSLMPSSPWRNPDFP